jgi:hypothetical protein
LSEPGEDVADIAQRFRQVLRRQGLPENLPLSALPDLGRPGQPAPAAVLPAPGSVETACARSRMLFQRGTTLNFSPCPFVDDDPSMDLGPDLAPALAASVLPRHARCSTCLATAVPYAG